MGTSLENIVFTVLNRECDPLSYVKDKYEIDFRCKKRSIKSLMIFKIEKQKNEN
jgi:predicted AAA+ superfamily ATPase